MSCLPSRPLCSIIPIAVFLLSKSNVKQPLRFLSHAEVRMYTLTGDDLDIKGSPTSHKSKSSETFFFHMCHVGQCGPIKFLHKHLFSLYVGNLCTDHLPCHCHPLWYTIPLSTIVSNYPVLFDLCLEAFSLLPFILFSIIPKCQSYISFPLPPVLFFPIDT